MMNNPKQKTTLRDFFKSYPYKKKSTESSGGIHYIPKQEIVDNHKFSITGSEYIEIVKVFFDVLLFEYLIWGYSYKMPHKFGHLVFRKCKNSDVKTKRRNIDWGLTRQYKEYNKANPENKKVFFHKNYHSQGYGVYLRWDKRGDVKFTNRYITIFILGRQQQLKLAKILKENTTIINYLNES
jgi:hypothetical protein